MGIVVFAEYETIETAISVEDWKGIDFVIPDDVIGFREGDAIFCFDQFFKRGHEILYFFALVHAAYTVVSGRNDTYQFAIGGAVFCDSHSGVAGLSFEGQNVSQCIFWGKVGVRRYETCFLCFHSGNHGCFFFRSLRTIDERNTTISCQFYCQFFTGDCLHNCRYHRNI